jgi:hemoglobin/transferrin/lactoferrin receptor protein
MRAKGTTGVDRARLVVFALAVALPLEAALPADNSESVTEIDEVVVVAHKHARARRDVAATVSVFRSEDFRFELGSSIADVFRYTPGIDYEAAGTRFGSESINIRGISGNRVAILVDGVPISDQFEVGSFSNATRDLVSAGFVGQVEVLHGPASALYGSSAIGGVVAIRTIDPSALVRRHNQGGQAVTNWRSSDTSFQATALQGIGGDRLSILGGISKRDGEQSDAAAAGDDLDTRDSRSNAGLLKIAFDDPLGNVLHANLYVRNSNVRSELESMLGTGRFRSNTALRGDDDYDTYIASLEYRFNSDSWLADGGVLRAYAQGSEVEQRTFDERGLASRPVAIERFFSFDQETRGIEANLYKEVVTRALAHQLGFGLEYRQRDTEEYRDGLETGLEDGQDSNVLLGEVFPLRDFPISTTTEWGAYVEDSISSGSWSLIAALRWDGYDMRPRVDALYAEDYPFATPVGISESEVSPKLGVIYRLAESTELFMQYSHGFRAPPYQDANISLELPLFNIRAVPNPELKSETSKGFDAGLRWRGNSSSAHVSLFRTDYDDFIESKVRIGTDADSGRILFQSQNIHSAVIEGIEAGTTLDLSTLRQGLSLDAALFVARGENGDSGESLNSVGPPQGVASLAWLSTDEHWRWSLRGTFTDSWSERDESSGELFEPPGYAVFDLYLAWRPDPRLTLRAGILNLTDRVYWSWTDVGGLAPDDPVIPYLSRPGRNFSLGLDMHW